MLNTSIVREENTTEYNTAGFFNSFHVHELIFYPLTVLCNLCGLVGNGKVIWILTSCSKTNLTSQIVNLAIADFGTLLSLSARVITNIIRCPYALAYELLDSLIAFTYSTSLYILTDIGLEACLSVLFPVWYQPGMSVVSFLLWIISGLLFGTLLVLAYNFSFDGYFQMENAIFTIDLLIFTPIMVGSTVLMSIKICWSAQRHHLPKQYIAVLATLLFFIVLTIPLSVIFFTMDSSGDFSDPGTETYFFFASVSSSVNPIIYYFVGRKRKRQGRESLKLALKRLFKDEGDLKGDSPLADFSRFDPVPVN